MVSGTNPLIRSSSCNESGYHWQVLMLQCLPHCNNSNSQQPAVVLGCCNCVSTPLSVFSRSPDKPQPAIYLRCAMPLCQASFNTYKP